MAARAATLAGVLVLAALPARPAPVPSPEVFLGFRVGADRRLADWRQSLAYFRALAASDRVSVSEVGSTTEGEPFVVVTITSETNQRRLESIRRTNLRLADPRGLPAASAEQLIARGKTIVASVHGTHATEVGASQTALELAHLLATSQQPRIRRILDGTVLLMVPCQNPDGMRKVVDWYRRSLGTDHEGGVIPFLPHKYTGRDNNRDWYMFTQVETRLTVAHVYDRWRPQIVHDLHQMGSRSARMFVPPYVDPYEPNVDPALVSATNALGSHVAAQLIAEAKTGVVTQAIYDVWSPARAYPYTHAGVRILSECAAARLASPTEVGFADLRVRDGFDPKVATWNHPAPWPGGSWQLRDVVDYQLSASLALLEHAAAHRELWLRGFVDVGRRAASRSSPFAYVFPAEQADPLATARLLQVLKLGGVELHRSRAGFEAESRLYARESHVVLMAQPYSGFAKSLLEPQRYPELREPAARRRPQGATAHTLPLMMGVEAVKVEGAFAAHLELVETVRVRPGKVSANGARSLALGHSNADLSALGQLLGRGVSVRWALEAFDDRDRRFPAGTLLVPVEARELLAPLAEELGIRAEGVDADPPALVLRRPRVGLYQSWVPAVDEGWTRFVFDRETHVEYLTLHDQQLREGGLQDQFDVVILPDQPMSRIVNGHPAGWVPDRYVGGIGEEGLEGLRNFVLAGGTLVTLNAACELALTELALPVSNLLDRDARPAAAREFHCPGSILRVVVDTHHPLAHGLETSSAVWFQNGPAMDLHAGTAVVRYPHADPLLSGWLEGGERLWGGVALAEVPVGRGRIVLFGFRPQYRAQTWATYIPLLNAIYTSAADRP